MAIKLSKEACRRVIEYSKNASESLQQNVNVMDNNVNSQFSGLHDPTFRKYLELSEQMQDYLRQISHKMDDISNYCERVMRWMDEYSNI